MLSGHLCHPALGNSHNSSVKCFDQERKALLQFKDGITQDYCGLLNSWIGDSDCCQWHGVHCSNYTGHVTMLRLQGSEFNPCIEGILSPSLCVLKHLRHLDLGSNGIVGPIPDFIGSLANLEYLNLSQNLFEPVTSLSPGNDSYSSHVQNLNWLSHLSLLRYLDLSGIDLSETENWIQIISKLPFLGVLQLDRCQLSVNIPLSLTHTNSTSNLRVISLSENGLFNSSIFQWLFNLPGITTQLLYLDLSFNSLTGPLPNDFSNLHHLSHLDLSNNQLDGPVPNYFGNLHHLSHLDLSNNQLDGPIPIGFSHLHHLSHLDLSNNYLEGHIPIEFESMKSLSYLSLSANNLQGSFEIFSRLCRLCNIEQLDLGGNNFTDEITNVIRALSKCENKKLLSLDLSQNHFWGAIPDSISSLTALKELYLDVSNAEMSGIIHVSFWNSLSFELQYLNMSHNQFSGLIPFFPNTDNSLSQVDLSSNLFEGAIPSGFTRAFALYLNDNKFSDSSYLFCSKTPSNLREIDLSNNLLSGKLSDCWMTFDQLFRLHLENNRFSGSIPKSMGTLMNLQYLHLDNNSFSGSIPASLENCTSLAILNLGYNSFTGNIPPFIGNVQALGVLILRKNHFLGGIPATLCQLQYLQILDFAMNHISGVIPRCIGNLTAMSGYNDTYRFLTVAGIDRQDHVTSVKGVDNTLVTWKREEQKFKDSLGYVKSIDFSYNELSGKIPDGVYNLTGLVSLDLSNNNMSGSISTEIGQLTALELLDLSGNHLTGKIPDSLAKLSFLAILDLSNNNLSGKIPIGNQLQTFDASSYTGNLGLCGVPLPKCPRDQADFNAPIINNSTGVQDKHENYDLFLGLYISVVLGFIIGFWGVFGILVIKRSWRHAWFRLVQDTHDRFSKMALGIIPQPWKKPRR